MPDTTDTAAVPSGEPFVARDLCDLSATAEEIAVELEMAANALGDALALLRSAREGIAALIVEVEAA